MGCSAPWRQNGQNQYLLPMREGQTVAHNRTAAARTIYGQKITALDKHKEQNKEKAWAAMFQCCGNMPVRHFCRMLVVCS